MFAMFSKYSLWTECKLLKLLDPLYINISLLILFSYLLFLLIFITLIYQILTALSNTGMLTQQWLPYIHIVFLAPTTNSSLASHRTHPHFLCIACTCNPAWAWSRSLFSGSAQKAVKIHIQGQYWTSSNRVQKMYPKILIRSCGE